MDHDETKLPLWAQVRLDSLRLENQSLRGEVAVIKGMHGLLSHQDRDWFTIPGPDFQEETRSLWVLNREDPFRICCLSKGDVLFVGRREKLRR